MSICENCQKEAPTQHVLFIKVTGLILAFRYSTLDATLCKQCVHRAFIQCFGHSLLFGWLGVRSSIVTLIALPVDLFSYLRALILLHPALIARRQARIEQNFEKIRPYAQEIIKRIEANEPLKQIAKSVAGRAKVRRKQIMAYIDMGNEYALDGQQAYKAEKYTVAVTKLEKAIALGASKYSRTYLYSILGHTYQALNRMEEAIAAHAKTTEINPNDKVAWHNLGVAYQLSNKFDEAECCYNHALAIDPNQANTHNQLGVILIRKNEPQQALLVLDKAIALDPKQASAHANLAYAYTMLEQADTAELHLKKAFVLGYKNSQVAVIQERIDQLRSV